MLITFNKNPLPFPWIAHSVCRKWCWFQKAIFKCWNLKFSCKVKWTFAAFHPSTQIWMSILAWIVADFWDKTIKFKICTRKNSRRRSSSSEKRFNFSIQHWSGNKSIQGGCDLSIVLLPFFDVYASHTISMLNVNWGKIFSGGSFFFDYFTASEWVKELEKNVLMDFFHPVLCRSPALHKHKFGSSLATNFYSAVLLWMWFYVYACEIFTIFQLFIMPPPSTSTSSS